MLPGFRSALCSQGVQVSRDVCSQWGLSVLRLAVATSGKAPSEEGFLPAFEQVSRLPLEQTIGGKSGVLTSFLKHFNTCLAHMLICTNSLSLLKGPFLQYVPASSSESIPHWWPQALLHASGRSVHLSHVAWFPCLPVQVGNAGPWWALEAGGTASGQESRSFPLGGGGLGGEFSLLSSGSSLGSPAHRAVPGGLGFSWWFLKCLVCRYPLSFLLQGLCITEL